MKLMTILSGAIMCIVAAGCDNSNANSGPMSVLPAGWGQKDTVSTPADTTKPVDPVGPEESFTDWTDVSSTFTGLPDYVKIFKSPAELEGRKAVAFIADVDLLKKSFSVWGISDPSLQGSSDALKTPSQVYDAKNKPAVVINGGYFYTDSGKSYAASLAVSNGTLLSPNINYTSQDWVTVYYPTRAVFLEHKDGTYEVAWSYMTTSGKHYVYQQPADNSWDKSPLKAPDAGFPSTAATFEAVNGIGGGPVLLKGGEVVNSYKAEMFDYGGINPTSPNNPRTAIGITADKHLVLFACEGRGMTQDVPGFTTEELANILKAYGCTDAINLDGGGSSMMLVCGKELFKPSDGSQRKVGSCVYIL